MTITQEARKAARQWFDQAEKDGVIRRGNRNDRPLAKAFQSAITAAEQRAYAKVLKAFEQDALLCDCFAKKAGECGCGAWDECKTITVHSAINIVRGLMENDDATDK